MEKRRNLLEKKKKKESPVGEINKKRVNRKIQNVSAIGKEKKNWWGGGWVLSCKLR